MNLTKLLTFALVVAPTFLFAQNTITYRMGDVGKKTSIDESITYNMSKTVLAKNSIINVYSTDNKYAVTKFNISVLPKNGQLLGPFKVNSANVQDFADAIGREIASGDKLYIEQIGLSCDDCVNPIEPKSMAIHVKVQ